MTPLSGLLWVHEGSGSLYLWELSLRVDYSNPHLWEPWFCSRKVCPNASTLQQSASQQSNNTVTESIVTGIMTTPHGWEIYGWLCQRYHCAGVWHLSFPSWVIHMPLVIEPKQGRQWSRQRRVTIAPALRLRPQRPQIQKIRSRFDVTVVNLAPPLIVLKKQCRPSPRFKHNKGLIASLEKQALCQGRLQAIRSTLEKTCGKSSKTLLFQNNIIK